MVNEKKGTRTKRQSLREGLTPFRKSLQDRGGEGSRGKGEGRKSRERGRPSQRADEAECTSGKPRKEKGGNSSPRQRGGGEIVK